MYCAYTENMKYAKNKLLDECERYRQNVPRTSNAREEKGWVYVIAS